MGAALGLSCQETARRVTRFVDRRGSADAAACVAVTRLLAQADRVPEFARPARRNVHQAGLVGKLAVEVDRAGKSVPGLDAEEWHAARFGPDAELTESLPGHFE